MTALNSMSTVLAKFACTYNSMIYDAARILTSSLWSNQLKMTSPPLDVNAMSAVPEDSINPKFYVIPHLWKVSDSPTVKLYGGLQCD